VFFFFFFLCNFVQFKKFFFAILTFSQSMAKMASTSSLTLNSVMMSQMAGGFGHRGGAGGGPMCTTNLVSRMALSKLTNVQQVYLAKVSEREARKIIEFPCTNWNDLKEVSRLLAPPGESRASLSDEDLRKGATIVSTLFTTFIFFSNFFSPGFRSLQSGHYSLFIDSFIFKFNY
jgi:hypothetical protein